MTTVPIAWSLPQSTICSRMKLGYTGHNRSIMLNRFCSQRTANLTDSAAKLAKLSGVIDAKHEGCASNATVNISPLDDPDTRKGKGLGIVEFIKEKNFLITGATGFVAKVLIEKILRMQPDTGKLFLVVRADDPASDFSKRKSSSYEYMTNLLRKRAEYACIAGYQIKLD